MLSDPHVWALVFTYSLYAAGCAAFGIFYAREDGATPAAFLKGILAALLLPALVGARRRAEGVACINNQGQLLIAWRLYADDNNDVLCTE